MKIQIIGAESLGARSMCCVVETTTRRIIIDPGVALAPRRFGLPPHPIELKKAEQIRQMILNELPNTTDVVISHFHGDHAPLKTPDPSQIPLSEFIARLGTSRLWVKSRTGNTQLMDSRYLDFCAVLNCYVADADGINDGELAFSPPVPHGERYRGTVMMTKITANAETFVHASDIQLLDESTISILLNWQPDILFCDGPPVYLPSLSPSARQEAFKNAVLLTQKIPLIIIDHHLLRSFTGLDFLQSVKTRSKGKIISAAEWTGEKSELLEARRRELYRAEKPPIKTG